MKKKAHELTQSTPETKVSKHRPSVEGYLTTIRGLRKKMSDELYIEYLEEGLATLIESSADNTFELVFKLKKYRGKKIKPENEEAYRQVFEVVKELVKDGMDENWAQATRKVARNKRMNFAKLYGGVRQWKIKNATMISAELNKIKESEVT